MATKAPKDSTIYFRAEGTDAKAALEALVTFGRRRFSGWTIERIELLIASKGGLPPPESRWDRCVALAPAKYDARQSRSAAEEHQALVDALAASQADLISLAHEAGDDEAEAILAFRRLSWKTITLPRRRCIDRRWRNAANRHGALRSIRKSHRMRRASDPYFRARASDLADLRDRVLRHLTGEANQIVPARSYRSRPTICLLPSFWPPIGVTGGLVLRRGSPSSHVLYLARSRGVPMICGGRRRSPRTWHGRTARWGCGASVVNPDSEMRTSYCQRRAEESEARQAFASFSGPALTATGELYGS